LRRQSISKGKGLSSYQEYALTFTQCFGINKEIAIAGT